MKMTRRQLLQAATCMMAGGLGSAVALQHREAPKEPAQLIDKLADFFTHKESAKRVGFEYLRSRPQEADPTMLVDLICAQEAKSKRRLSLSDGRTARAILLQQIRRDFAAGRVINIGGLVMSNTEGRLSALALLT